MSRRSDREEPREDWGQLHPASRGRGREGLPHRGRLGCREVDPGWHGSGRKPRGGSEEDRGPEVLSWILREAVCLGAVPVEVGPTTAGSERIQIIVGARPENAATRQERVARSRRGLSLSGPDLPRKAPFWASSIDWLSNRGWEAPKNPQYRTSQLPHILCPSRWP